MSSVRLYAGLAQSLGEDEVAGVCVSAGVKRDGDAWNPAGVDLTEYRRNPVVLREHNPDQLIGSAAAIGLTPDGNSIAIRIKFAPPGSSVIADEARALAKAGVLRGISAGIDPLEIESLRNGTSGRFVIKSELLEVSLVAIPADADSLVTARNFRSRSDMESILRTLQPTSEGAMRRVLEQVGCSTASERPFGLLSAYEQAVLIQQQHSARCMATWGLQRAERERELDYSREQRRADLLRLTEGGTKH